MNRNTCHHHLSILAIIVLLVLLPVYQATNLSNIVEQTCNSQHVISPVEGPMNSSWPMYCHDAQRTGRSPYAAEGLVGVECWRFRFDDRISHTSPAIANDGTIYVGGDYISGEGYYFYAINPDGTMKWRYKCNGQVDSSPAISDDGTIYIGANGDPGYLYAVNPNGTLKWRTQIGSGGTKKAPVIDQQGIIYMTCVMPGNICAIYPNGTLKWTYQTNDWVYSSPTLSLDESIVYCGSDDYYMYALNAENGSLLWRYQAQGKIQCAATVSTDDTLYFGSWDGYLYALHPNGTLRRRKTIGLCDDVSPAIADDGTIYIGSISKKLYSFNPDGSLNWEFQTGNEIYSSPAIDANGIIYFGSFDGQLYAVNPDGTQRWRFETGGKVHSSPAIDEQGRIYFIAYDDEQAESYSYLYAVEIREHAANLNLEPLRPWLLARIAPKITNIGDEDARNVNWHIQLVRMGEFPWPEEERHYNGTFETIRVGETKMFQAWPVFGFGMLYSQISATASGINPACIQQWFFVLGPLVIPVDFD